MGSSKVVSNQELFFLVFLFQQSGLFWLLPYFLVRENGTSGLVAIFGGIGAALAILYVYSRWYIATAEVGFVTVLKKRNMPLGIVVGMMLIIFYILYGAVSLYSFIDVVQKQLLPATPAVVLCVSLLLLVGWMSWGGLETIVRLTQLCFGALLVLVILSIVGSSELFSFVHGLPLQVKNVDQLREAVMHSIFCYSGLLVLFMIDSSHNVRKGLKKQLWLAVILGGVLVAGWTWYALGVFGQYSLQTILWIPAHLARMVQISVLFEQTESLFVVLWMTLVLTGSGLVLWCASKALHQLLHKQKSIGLHGVLLLVVLAVLLTLHNSLQFMALEYWLARTTLVVLPLLLLSIWILTPKKGAKRWRGDYQKESV